MIKAYNKSKLSVCCTACCCCEGAAKKDYRFKVFHKKWLQVDAAAEPDLINWENLGLSRKARCFRISLLSVISLLLLFLTTLGILYAKVKEQELTKGTIVCTDLAITEEEALADYLLSQADGEHSDTMWCYCRGIMWEYLGKKESPYDALRKPFSDDEMHCWEWFGEYSLASSLVYLVPFSIVFVNWLSKTILKVMTTYYGYQSKPEEVYASTVNMFYLTVINSGLVIQFVYLKWTDVDVPLLLGEFTEFT